MHVKKTTAHKLAAAGYRKPYAPNWADIPEGHNWVGVGRTGNVNAFKSKPFPYIGKGVWWVEPVFDAKIVGDTMEFSFTYGDVLICPPIDPPGKRWRTMLYERPKQN